MPSTRGAAAAAQATAAAATTTSVQPPQLSTARPLDGCSVAICGTIDGLNQARVNQAYLEPLGAALAKTVNAGVTHLITSQADFNKRVGKVKSAETHNIHIVSFNWLSDCLINSRREDESSYSLTTPAPAASPTNGNGQDSQVPAKRSAKAALSGDGGDDNDKASGTQQPPKKAKAEETKPEEEPLKEGKSKEAKVAEGQVAKSLDVVIPLDEGADRQLRRYEVYISDDGIIYDASLNQTNASNNNNKFYRIQVRACPIH